MKARIVKGNQKYGSLRTLMKSKYLSMETKRCVCLWELSEEDQLERWGRKISRNILGENKF